MRRSALFIALFIFSIMLASCSAPAPTWRAKTTFMVEELERQQASKLFPQEFRSMTETFEHGEAFLHVEADDGEADRYYLMALQKGAILKDELRRLNEQRAEEERRQAAERAAVAEEERLMREAAEAEARLRMKEEELAKVSVKIEVTRPAYPKEPPPVQPPLYTVRRGETLPQIAGRTEIYNDASLWPLIYRANRDQIRDPKRLWPGQLLTIPRHFSKDDALEARRYSGKK